MRLYVPSLGDKLVLAKPWTFPLFHERRNMEMLRDYGFTYQASRWDGEKWVDKSEEVTIPAGVELTVRRIYIRQGQKPFDSITFSATIPPQKAARRGAAAKPFKARFWAKLRDCDGIEFAEAA